MAMTVHVDIVSAEQQLFSGLAEFVVLPGESVSLVFCHVMLHCLPVSDLVSCG